MHFFTLAGDAQGDVIREPFLVVNAPRTGKERRIFELLNTSRNIFVLSQTKRIGKFCTFPILKILIKKAYGEFLLMFISKQMKFSAFLVRQPKSQPNLICESLQFVEFLFVA